MRSNNGFVDEMVRFRFPLYTVAEAARIVGVPRQTLAGWAQRYGLVSYVPPEGRFCPAVPFVGLAEAMVLAGLLRSGVSMRRIRPAVRALDGLMGLDHVLASRRLYSDGVELLFDYAEERWGGFGLSGLVVVRSGQRVFAEVVMGFLENIVYGEDGYPVLMRVPAYEVAEVVVDPKRSFGCPIFSCGAARVEDVLDRYGAGTSLEVVSKDYGVPTDHIEDALRVASFQAA